MACQFCSSFLKNDSSDECPGETCPLNHFPKCPNGFLEMLSTLRIEDRGAALNAVVQEARCRVKEPILGMFGLLQETRSEFQKLHLEFQFFLEDQMDRIPLADDSLELHKKLHNLKEQHYELPSCDYIQVLKDRVALLEANKEKLSRELCKYCKRRFDAEQCGPEVKQLCKGKEEIGPKKVDVGNQEEIGLEKVDVRITEVKEVTKVSQTKKPKQLSETVIDLGPPADWVIVNVENKEDFFEIYALVPGLSREELNVEFSRGRLLISGKPKQANNPWGITAFKKQVILPRLELNPAGTLAIVNPRGILIVRIPYATA